MCDYPLEIQKISQRKTISISVCKGRLLIKSPKGVSDRFIQDLIRKKRNWIDKQFTKAKTLALASKDYHYQTGAKIRYLGRSLSLQLIKSSSVSIATDDNTFLIRTQVQTPGIIKSIIHDWLYQQAVEIFETRVPHYARKLKLGFDSIRLKRYRRRWGSCDTRARLSFNWLLIQADQRIIDYVICHELSHIHHMNHSSEFWECVAKVCPQYKDRRKWLRDHGDELMLL